MLWGAYDTCNFTSPTGGCTWEGECPDFELPVSGRALTDTLTINLHPNQVVEHAVGNCLGTTVYFDPVSCCRVPSPVPSATMAGTLASLRPNRER